MGGRPPAAGRQGKGKLIEHFETGRLELYDLKNDVSESSNLVQTESRTVERLQSLLVKWRGEMKALVPSRPNPNYRRE